MSSNSLRVEKATGAAAIAHTIAPGVEFKLIEIRVHLSAAGGAGNLTVNLDSINGAAYDLNVLTQDMTAITDLVWQPDIPMHFQTGDELDVAWANAGTKTYGIEIIYDLT